MIKRILVFLLFVFLVNYSSFSQIKSNYSRGFEIGFAEGYCYNRETVDCFRPITPLAPLPRINESKEDYTQGYNRGFQYGLDLKRSNDALNNSDVKLHNRLIQFNDYVSQQPVSAMIAVGMLKQEKYDSRVEWMQNKMNNLVGILRTLYQNHPERNKIIENEGDKLVSMLNPYAAADFADDYQFKNVQNIFYTHERNIYNNYNNYVKSYSRSYNVSESGFTDNFNSRFVGKSFECKAYKLNENKQDEIFYKTFSHNSVITINADNINFRTNQSNTLARRFNRITYDPENSRFICYTDYGNINIDENLKYILFFDSNKPSYSYEKN